MDKERMDSLKREADSLAEALKAIGKKEQVARNREMAEFYARNILSFLWFAGEGFLTARQKRAMMAALEIPATSIRRWRFVLALADEIMIIGKG